MCKKGLKVNAGKIKVMVLNRQEGLECATKNGNVCIGNGNDEKM